MRFGQPITPRRRKRPALGDGIIVSEKKIACCFRVVQDDEQHSGQRFGFEQSFRCHRGFEAGWRIRLVPAQVTGSRSSDVCVRDPDRSCGFDWALQSALSGTGPRGHHNAVGNARTWRLFAVKESDADTALVRFRLSRASSPMRIPAGMNAPKPPAPSSIHGSRISERQAEGMISGSNSRGEER